MRMAEDVAANLRRAFGTERRFENALDYAFSADGSALYYTASGEEGAADGVVRVGRAARARA